MLPTPPRSGSCQASILHRKTARGTGTGATAVIRPLSSGTEGRGRRQLAVAVTLALFGALLAWSNARGAGDATTPFSEAAATASSRTSEHDYDAPVPGSYTLPVIRPAADGEVLDPEGRPLRLRELTRGRVTVMSFIYTRCASSKACPYATGVLKDLYEQSASEPALAANLRLVSMSFDPVNDTPERMAAYASRAQSDKPASEWRFVTAPSQQKLQPILDAYGQAVNRKKNPFDPAGPLNHSLRVFLIDREGRIRNIYSSGTLDLRLVLSDVRTLLMESSRLNPVQAVQQPRDRG